MSDKDEKYALMYITDSWAQRTVGAFIFWGYLAFLVWLSVDSVWWTFLFGTVALLSLYARAKYIYDKYTHKFTSKAELRAFVEKLPERGNS